ncbi:MAG: alpha/beta fold hydrolase, partial [Polaromonas sp.]
RQDAPVSAANACRQLWAAAGFSSAAVPHCPALVLSSRADQLVHPHCSARLARAWQAEHHEHPWAGHDLPHDDAAWVCQRVAGWLGGA